MSYTIHPTISNKSDLCAGQPPKYPGFGAPCVSAAASSCQWFIPCFAHGTSAKDVLVLSARIARSTRLSRPSFTCARVFEPLHAETCSIVRGSTTKATYLGYSYTYIYSSSFSHLSPGGHFHVHFPSQSHPPDPTTNNIHSALAPPFKERRNKQKKRNKDFPPLPATKKNPFCPSEHHDDDHHQQPPQ